MDDLEKHRPPSIRFLRLATWIVSIFCFIVISLIAWKAGNFIPGQEIYAYVFFGFFILHAVSIQILISSYYPSKQIPIIFKVIFWIANGISWLFDICVFIGFAFEFSSPISSFTHMGTYAWFMFISLMIIFALQLINSIIAVKIFDQIRINERQELMDSF